MPDHRQLDVAGRVHRMMHSVVGHHRFALGFVRAAGVEVAGELREVRAGHLDPDAMPLVEADRGRDRRGLEGVHLPRLHQPGLRVARSEEHTSELQSLMRISYAVFCLKKKKTNNTHDRVSYTR